MRLAASEEDLARQLADWLFWQHRELRGLAHFDFGTGTKLTIGQARKQKSLNPQRGWPDLFIAMPTYYPDTLIAGLFIELKTAGTRLQKRDGSWASPHIAEQAAVLERLREVGYAAHFGIGLDDCIRLVEQYLTPAKAHDVRRRRTGTATDVVYRPAKPRKRDMEPF